MNDKIPNPPAFPSFVEGYSMTRDEMDDLNFTGTHSGMTLRDWFAGMALQGICAKKIPKLDGMAHTFPTYWRPYISGAYKIADEMLAERSKPTS